MTTTGLATCILAAILVLFGVLPLMLYQCAKFLTYGWRRANEIFDKNERENQHEESA